MKLHEFLDQANDDNLAPAKPVKFKVIGSNAKGHQTTMDASAVLVFVPEHARQRALLEAEKAMHAESDGKVISPDRQDDENIYHILFEALRDESDHRTYFARNFKELKLALVKPVAKELYTTYTHWVSEEFPASIDDAQFDALVEEAKKKSLVDLLSCTEFSTILRVLPSLAALYGK